MKFYQHIYGRVAKGYQASYSGYQIAALTDSLADQQELLRKLNRYSFFHRYEGEGNKERYSFYRPAPGLLVFGCSRMVKDATGSVGSFAHNFICEENDFLKAEVSPIALLKALPFVASEDQIGSARSLPIYPLDSVAQAPGAPEWRQFAHSLIDTYLGESVLVIPMVVLGAAEMWGLLTELFARLSPGLAARLSFSTLFKDATDYVEEFRLVFVPDQKTVPRDAQIYRVLDPGPERVASITPSPTPYTKCLDKLGEKYPEFILYINKIERAPDEPAQVDEAARHWPPLLEPRVAKPVREAIEFLVERKNLDIRPVYASLVRNCSTDLLVAYGRAGEGLESQVLRAAVWAEAEAYLLPALEAAQQLQQWSLCTAFLEDLARHLATDATGLSLVRQLARAGYLNDFFEAVNNSTRLTEREQTVVAERLRSEPHYDGQIHWAIARKLLRKLAESGREGTRRSAEWLRDESRLLSDELVRAAADLWEWDGLPTRRRPDFKLQAYQFASAGHYEAVLPAAWRASLPFTWESRIEVAYHSAYRLAFFTFCAGWLRQCDLEEQKDLLRTLGRLSSPPYGRENQLLIDGIRRVERPYELAQHYVKVLQKLPDIDGEAIRQLQSFQPPPSFWDTFRR